MIQGMLTLAIMLAATGAIAQPQPDRAVEVRPRVMVAFSGGSFLGVSAMNLTAELQEFYGAGEDSGVLIGQVTGDGPAEAAGLRVGDVVTRVGERAIRSAGDLRRAVMALDPGASVEIGFVRERAPAVVTATIGEREGAQWFSDDVGRDIHVQIDPHELRENVRESMENLDFSGLRTHFEDLRERMDEADVRAIEERLAALETKLREMEERLTERPE